MSTLMDLNTRPSRICLGSPLLSEASQSSWTPSSLDATHIQKQELTSTPRDRQRSPALSDTSDLSWLSRSPSPPPGTPAPRIYLGSQVSSNESSDSDSSDGSTFLACPSPAREFTSRKAVQIPKGRFVDKRKKRSDSPDIKPRTPKMQKLSPVCPPATPTKRDFTKAVADSPILFVIPRKVPTTPTHTNIRHDSLDNQISEFPSPGVLASAPPFPIVAVTGLGVLEKLPREVRDIIYGFALDIKTPVTVKECCGPTSTKRERDACKKHGKTGCKKIGIRNGLYTGFTEMGGKFDVLVVSKAIYEEASWVLFNQGSLLLKVAEYLTKYVNDRPVNNVRHLQNLPHNDHAHNLWMTVARFRKVRLQIPAATMKYGDPTAYTARLSETAALLLKSWEVQPKRPTSQKSREVIIDLGELYEVIPFNAETYSEEYVEWAQLHYPFGTPNPDDICNNASYNIERTIEIVGRHCGSSIWKINVVATINDEDEYVDADGNEMESANWLYGLEDHCNKYELGFEIA